MDRRICIFTVMRLQSERLPEKMLLPLGSKPLCRWAVDTMREAAEETGVACRIALGGHDYDLVDAVNEAGVDIIWRTAESLAGEDNATIYDQKIRDQMTDVDWIVFVNPCFPFLPLDDLVGLVERAKTADRPLVGAIRQRNWIWWDNGVLLAGDPSVGLNTKTNPATWLPGHCWSAWPASMLGTTEMLMEPEFIQLPDTWRYKVDVDTKDDYDFARIVFEGNREREYKRQHEQGGCAYG